MLGKSFFPSPIDLQGLFSPMTPRFVPSLDSESVGWALLLLYPRTTPPQPMSASNASNLGATWPLTLLNTTILNGLISLWPYTSARGCSPMVLGTK